MLAIMAVANDGGLVVMLLISDVCLERGWVYNDVGWRKKAESRASDVSDEQKQQSR
jgi:hypothetical protein